MKVVKVERDNTCVRVTARTTEREIEYTCADHAGNLTDDELREEFEMMIATRSRSKRVLIITRREKALHKTYALGLEPEQRESLRQYANECKMRPGEFPDAWRSVPTSNEEFRVVPDKAYWLQIANTF